jgi:hypothetical protein
MILEFILRGVKRVPPASWINAAVEKRASAANVEPWSNPFCVIWYSTVCGAVDGFAISLPVAASTTVLGLETTLSHFPRGEIGSGLVIVPAFAAGLGCVILGKVIGGVYGFGRGLYRVRQQTLE